MFTYGYAIVGGLLIGLASVLLLLSIGRIAGISGIFWRALTSSYTAVSGRARSSNASSIEATSSGNNQWSWFFIAGLPIGTGLFHWLSKQPIPEFSTLSLYHAVIAGLLVGFGVKLGSGCTSGHGVCGIGRLSIRSIVATCTFMGAGIVTVYVIRHWI